MRKSLQDCSMGNIHHGTSFKTGWRLLPLPVSHSSKTLYKAGKKTFLNHNISPFIKFPWMIILRSCSTNSRDLRWDSHLLLHLPRSNDWHGLPSLAFRETLNFQRTMPRVFKRRVPSFAPLFQNNDALVSSRGRLFEESNMYIIRCHAFAVCCFGLWRLKI